MKPWLTIVALAFSFAPSQPESPADSGRGDADSRSGGTIRDARAESPRDAGKTTDPDGAVHADAGAMADAGDASADCPKDAGSAAGCAGECGPTELVSDEYFAAARLAVDATHMYWARAGTVKKRALEGGDPVTIIEVEDTEAAGPIAVDATSVYWAVYLPASNTGSVLKAPLEGGPAITLAAGQLPSSIAIDGANVYWTNSQSAVAAADGSVMKVPIDGGRPEALASNLRGPNAITVDRTHVYWLDNATAEGGHVMSAPIAGGDARELAVEPLYQQYPAAIAVDESNVYWTAYGLHDGTGAVKSVPIAGGSPAEARAEQLFPAELLLHGTSLYWLGGGSDTGTVMEVPLAGGMPLVLARPPDPQSLVADATHLYWASPWAIMRMVAPTSDAHTPDCS